MYRVMKVTRGVKEEVLFANSHKEVVLDTFVDSVLESASNGEDYTQDDIEEIRESESEVIGKCRFYIDEVKDMTAEEFEGAEGGVCVSCHSDNVDAGELAMDNGFVTRKLICNVCDNETIETYTLNGHLGS